jgi:hypothetical protein
MNGSSNQNAGTVILARPVLAVWTEKWERLSGKQILRELVLPADIDTVNPDRKRTIGRGKFVPAPLAALDEKELFVAQFLLQPLRYIA